MRKILYTLLFACSVCGVFPREQEDCSAIVRRTLEAEGVNFSNDNSMVLFKNGQEKFDDLFSAIRQAKKSIHLEYFNFRNDSIATLLFALLADKAKEGIQVRAIFDAFGNSSNNRPLKKEHLKKIRQNGIEIYEFDPICFPWLNHIWARDHRKIVVIDGKVAYIGGMNVADYYINGTKQVGEWRDTHCRLEGMVVDELQRIFIKAWNKASHQNLDATLFLCKGKRMTLANVKPDTTSSQGKKTLGIINREPYVSNEIIKTFYYTAIQNAQRHIQIVNPYFTLNRKLKKCLKKALQRGVKVEIMLSAKFDEPVTPDVVYRNAHKLIERGAYIYIYKPGFHHSKVMMVDGEMCTVGSANLDARSLSYDYEDNVVVFDRHTTAELQQIFENDKKQSFQLTLDNWKSFRTPWQRFRGQMFTLLTPFL